MVTQGWRVDKHIPIAVIVTILIQTCGAFWWAATVTARIDALERARFDTLNDSLQREKRVQAMERQLPVIKEKIDTIKEDTTEIKRKLDKISVMIRRQGALDFEGVFAMSLNELGEVTV